MAGWISEVTGKNPGGLHKSLNIPADNIIPKAKIMKAEHADNPKVAKEARLAQTLEHLNKRCGGGKV